jgi:hypothetical protein
MAYLRGPLYLWSDDDGLHLWQASPPNTEMMEVSGWAQSYANEPRAAVYLPNATFDDLAMRRYMEMTDDEREQARRRVERKRKGATENGN